LLNLLVPKCEQISEDLRSTVQRQIHESTEAAAQDTQEGYAALEAEAAMLRPVGSSYQPAANAAIHTKAQNEEEKKGDEPQADSIE